MSLQANREEFAGASEECVISVFWYEEWTQQGSVILWLLSFLAYSSDLNIKVIYSSETSVNFCSSIRDHIPDDNDVLSHHCENCKRHDKYVWHSSTIYILFIETKIECDLQNLLQTLNLRFHWNKFSTVGNENWYLPAKNFWRECNLLYEAKSSLRIVHVVEKFPLMQTAFTRARH